MSLPWGGVRYDNFDSDDVKERERDRLSKKPRPQHEVHKRYVAESHIIENVEIHGDGVKLEVTEVLGTQISCIPPGTDTRNDPHIHALIAECDAACHGDCSRCDK